MVHFQTEIQNQPAIRLGSCKFEVATYADTPVFVDLGAMTGVEFQETIEIQDIKSDNCPPIKRVKNHYATIKGTWMEPTLKNIALLRGSFDTLTQVAGTDTLETGGNDELGYLVVRLTNTNAASKTYAVTFNKAQVTGGLDQKFNADTDMSAATIALELKAELDLTKDVGAQLMTIVDMQAPETEAA